MERHESCPIPDKMCQVLSDGNCKGIYGPSCPFYTTQERVNPPPEKEKPIKP